VTDGTQAPPLDVAQTELLTRATRAARELCELLWEALHQELRHPREERVRDLSLRLAEVSSTVALLTGDPAGGLGPSDRRNATTPVEPGPAGPDAPVSPLSPVPDPTRPDPTRTEPARPEPARPEPARPEPARPEPAAGAARMRLVDELESSESPVEMAMSASVEAHHGVGGVRPQEGASAWVNTVGQLLERHALDGLPFAVLLVEVVDVAHIERSESPVQVNNLIAQVEGALGRALRSHDTLTRESLGRYWLVAPETNGTGARMLGERLARLVRSSASHRGVPLEVAVGIAVCPEDGIEAPELAARADLSVYSARATGQPVARADPPAS
jgi:GGDEF domain-containing protein